MNNLSFTVSQFINKEISEVFDAVVKAEKITQYFTRKSNADLTPATNVTWSWDNESGVVKVDSVENNKRICFLWKAYQVPYNTKVEIRFSKDKEGCRVAISESGWINDEAGTNSSYSHCHGWTHMLMCLKAWIEHGIDLR